jgi:hypothetical protein
MRLTWNCPRSVWTHLLAHSAQATFFHSPAWADVVRVNGMGEPQAMLAQWQDGRQALCVVGVRPVWGGLIRAARSGTAGGYGGLVANGPLSEYELRVLYRALWRRFGECGGLSNPFAQPPPNETGFRLHPAPPTLAVRLAPLSDLRQRYTLERLRAVTRYQKREVQLRVVRQPTADDWRQFMRLYEHETGIWRQQGRPLHLVRDARWFASLQQASGHQLRITVATVAGETVGMLVYAIQHRIATELYVVWDHAYAQYQVTTALKEASLAECHATGLRWFDLMPSGSLAGVEHFKVSFGAEPLPVWEFYHPSWASRSLSLIRPPREPAIAG